MYVGCISIIKYMFVGRLMICVFDVCIIKYMHVSRYMIYVSKINVVFKTDV